MTLGSKLRALLAVHAFDLKVAIIESVDQVRRGSRRFPTPDRPIVQNDNRLPFVCEQIGSRETGNACADHAHIRSGVLIERGPGRHFCRCHPNGSTSARTLLHTFSSLYYSFLRQTRHATPSAAPRVE